MPVENTRKVMMRYFEGHYEETLADDVVFTDMTSCEESRTPQGVADMIHWFYHVAFEATTDVSNTIFGDDNAVIEAHVVGKHIGEYAGIPATGKDIRVPLCVIYDVENGQIKRGRIYFNVTVLQKQLSV